MALNSFHEWNEIIFVTLHRAPNVKWIALGKLASNWPRNNPTFNTHKMPNTVALNFSSTHHHSVVPTHIYHLLDFINYLNRLQFASLLQDTLCTVRICFDGKFGPIIETIPSMKWWKLSRALQSSQCSELRAHAYIWSIFRSDEWVSLLSMYMFCMMSVFEIFQHSRNSVPQGKLYARTQCTLNELAQSYTTNVKNKIQEQNVKLNNMKSWSNSLLIWCWCSA